MDELMREEVEERIAELVQEYRDFKITIDSLDEDQKAVKRELKPLIEKYGKWSDGEGYASIVERGPSVRYKSSEVEKLVEAWKQSDDAMLKSAAMMLEQHRSERSGYSYVRVK